MNIEIETPRGAVDGVWADGEPVVVVAHGAGNDMHAPLLAGFTQGLAGGGVGSLRFNFLYKQVGRRAPDTPAVLREVWTAVFEEAARRATGAAVIAAGKSLGGRIASLLVAEGVMPAAALVFLGYPLHPPGKPERLRDEHLDRVLVPMLFLEGTRDPFARWDLIETLCERLGDRATLHRVEGGDHSFRVRGSPQPDDETGRTLAEVAVRFVRGLP